MSKTITIDPVTRIEGHSKITIQLDDQGQVDQARFHVTQFRGFEKFTEGRPYYEMPGITARICGICPISHLLASAKACDDLLGVRLPPAADRARRILHMGQTVQSHALSFFHLSAPDILLGMDADPAKRHVLGLAQAHPEIAKEGIWLRMFGQQIIEWLAGRRIHPAWVAPGGVATPLTAEVRDKILEGIPRAIEITQRALDLWRGVLDKFKDEIATFGNFPTHFLSLTAPDGGLDLYDGHLRLTDAERGIVADKLDPTAYDDYIGEAVEPWSYLKMPFYKPQGYPDGIYRVGPLARLNNADHCGTELADKELVEFRKLSDGAVLSSFHYHYARLIEILSCLETARELLNHPDSLSTNVRAKARPSRNEGVGVAEAPRGTLIHHYRINEDEQITWANLIIATGHNNLAMNRGITQAAKKFVQGDRIEEGALNRVEAVIRCYDPCLSCSTHALGQMALQLQLLDPKGNVLDEKARA
ncbi:MAG: Ni/Fe hydrogenase subunit alpha [Candidatus Hydrogenedentota bacterium]